MNLDPEYVRAAYLLEIAEYVENHIIEEFVIQGGGDAKRTLTSDRVLKSDAEVKQDAFHEFLRMIRDLGSQAKEQMNEFEHRRKPAGISVRGFVGNSTERARAGIEPDRLSAREPRGSSRVTGKKP